MYKLVAFDLDGTLLNDNKTIFKENIDIVHRLMEDGIEIIISTGRGYKSCQSLVKMIEDDIACICNNGAVARTLRSQNEIFSNYLDEETSLNIIKLGEELETSPLVHVNGYYENIDVIYKKSNRRYSKDNRAPNSSLNYMDVNDFNMNNIKKVLALAFFDDKDIADKLYRETAKMENKNFNYHLMENTTMSDSLVEYMGLNVNKWNGIMEYAESKNIETKDIIVFGDDNNDYEMIKNAGLGIAMNNATDRVKSVADIITDRDNNDITIYKALKDIFY